MFASPARRLNKAIVIILTLSLAACTTTVDGGKGRYVKTGSGRQGVLEGKVPEHKLSARQRAELARQRQQSNNAIAGALMGAAIVGGVALAASSRRGGGYSDYSGFSGGYAGSSGHNGCGLQVWTPNPQVPTC